MFALHCHFVVASADSETCGREVWQETVRESLRNDVVVLYNRPASRGVRGEVLLGPATVSGAALLYSRHQVCVYIHSHVSNLFFLQLAVSLCSSSPFYAKSMFTGILKNYGNVRGMQFTNTQPLNRSRAYASLHEPIAVYKFFFANLQPQPSIQALLNMDNALFMTLNVSIHSLMLPNYRSCFAPGASRSLIFSVLEVVGRENMALMALQHESNGTGFVRVLGRGTLGMFI